MADLLRVTCHECGTSFVSTNRDRRDALAADADLTLEERCPHCGYAGTYRAVEYHHGSLVGPCRPLTPSSPA